MKQLFEVGDIIRYYTEEGSFRWQNGLYIVISIDDDVLHLSKLTDDLKYNVSHDSSTSITNRHISKTEFKSKTLVK